MKRLEDELEVEPLSERRWAAIEASVLSRIDDPATTRPSLRPPSCPPSGLQASRRRPTLLVAGGLAVAAAALLGLWIARGDAPGTWDTARVETGEHGARTSFGEVEVELYAASELTAVGDDARGWLVVLERGGARFHVPPRRGRAPFVLQAGGTRVEVIGTRFTVAREPSGTTRVAVDQGTVRVVASGEETLVHAGERWPADTTEPTEPAEPAEPAEPTVALEPTDTAGPVMAAEAEPVEAEEPEPLRTSRSRRPSVDEGASRASTDDPTPAAPTSRQRFEQAAALEAADPARAAALYRALEREGGPWAANALFARGRLELERGRPAEAERLLRSYLARHPRGPNAADARALLP